MITKTNQKNQEYKKQIEQWKIKNQNFLLYNHNCVKITSIIFNDAYFELHKQEYWPLIKDNCCICKDEIHYNYLLEDKNRINYNQNCKINYNQNCKINYDQNCKINYNQNCREEAKWQRYLKKGNYCQACLSDITQRARIRAELKKDFMREIMVNYDTPDKINKEALAFFNLNKRRLRCMQKKGKDYLYAYLFNYISL